MLMAILEHAGLEDKRNTSVLIAETLAADEKRLRWFEQGVPAVTRRPIW
jgi:hypothetical protein